MLPEVRVAHLGDVPAIAAALARAFQTDPIASYIFPDVTRRPSGLTAFFALQLRHHYFPRGEVYTTDPCAGASLWIPPSPRPPKPSDVLAQVSLARIVWGRVRATRRFGMLLARHHPRVPHYYLATIGVDPHHQRTGLGAALLRPVLARCDSEGIPAYLECSREDNVAFYARSGFVVTREIDVTAKGPRLWLMWRTPNASTDTA